MYIVDSSRGRPADIMHNLLKYTRRVDSPAVNGTVQVTWCNHTAHAECVHRAQSRRENDITESFRGHQNSYSAGCDYINRLYSDPKY